jgi:hypothetical protein
VVLDAHSAGRDARESDTFCDSLRAGARFETRELLWCDAGWPGEDGGPPGPDAAPDLYCHWSLEFSGTTVHHTALDVVETLEFQCSSDGLTIGTMPVTADPTGRVLTYEGDDYVSVE